MNENIDKSLVTNLKLIVKKVKTKARKELNVQVLVQRSEPNVHVLVQCSF